LSGSEPQILILIPAYNEGQRVAAVVEGARAHGLPVLVVDDGSSDDTAAVAEVAGATVIRQPHNQGKGAALKQGFAWALEQGFDHILTLDADGQHDPAEIPLFLEANVRDAGDLLIGMRNFDDMPLVRRAANRLGQLSLSAVLGETVHDNQSGYRLISRRLADAMLLSLEEGFEFEVDMIVVSRLNGYKLGWVPIATIYAGEGSHINPVQHFVNYVRMLWRIRRRLRQLPPEQSRQRSYS
jgi:glycosyltransferase involved in cell wall biosynthesis